MARAIYGEYVAQDWTALTLQSGWVAASGTGTTKPPIGFCVTGSTVQLRGEVTPPGILAGNLLIGTLPTGARPPFEYFFPIGILGLAGAGGIRVFPSGEVRLEGVTALTSLALNGIRFSLKV